MESTDLAKDCNLYIVSRRPRISVHPDSVFIDEERFSLTLREQREDAFRELHIAGRHALGKGPFKWVSSFPYEDFSIVDAEGNAVAGGVVAIAAVGWGMIAPSALPQEVIYIGQAFGKAGERTAYDRLKSHSTLQRIYSENRPDLEIWLSLCRLSDMNLASEIDPTYEAIRTDEEDDEHVAKVFSRVNESGFASREAVAIAEAGMIAYFRPIYNEKFKDNYPDPRHVHISTCYDLELSNVVVELQGQDIDACYYSSDVPRPSSIHFMKYPLYDTYGMILGPGTLVAEMNLARSECDSRPASPADSPGPHDEDQ